MEDNNQFDFHQIRKTYQFDVISTRFDGKMAISVDPFSIHKGGTYVVQETNQPKIINPELRVTGYIRIGFNIDYLQDLELTFVELLGEYIDLTIVKHDGSGVPNFEYVFLAEVSRIETSKFSVNASSSLEKIYVEFGIREMKIKKIVN